jgi:Ser/Thr protein kinase RdoA (MazF antagonist)
LLSSLPTPPLGHTPRFSVEKAVSIAGEIYGLHVTASPLPSERDQNFLLTSSSNDKFVLRIANGLEDPALLKAQNEVLRYLSSRFPFCQRLILTKQGRDMEEIRLPDGRKNLVRLNTYLPGIPLGEIDDHSQILLKDFGLKLGLLDNALLEVDYPVLHRNFHWDLANWNPVLVNYCELISDEQLRIAISHYAAEFERDVAPLLSQLRRSCIHGDANDYNILVERDSSVVTGFLDFGDMVYSYTVGDLAIALAYVVLEKQDPLSVAMNLVAGYRGSRFLTETEIEVLWRLVLMRLCMSVCLAAYQQQQRPDNHYLDISQQAIRSCLPKLMAIDPKEAIEALKSASV